MTKSWCNFSMQSFLIIGWFFSMHIYFRARTCCEGRRWWWPRPDRLSGCHASSPPLGVGFVGSKLISLLKQRNVWSCRVCSGAEHLRLVPCLITLLISTIMHEQRFCLMDWKAGSDDVSNFCSIYNVCDCVRAGPNHQFEIGAVTLTITKAWRENNHAIDWITNLDGWK